MARSPASKTQHRDEPSIIIDPSLYVPEHGGLLQTLCDAFVDVTRVVLVIALAGVTVFSVVHVLRTRSLTTRANVFAPLPGVRHGVDASEVEVALASGLAGTLAASPPVNLLQDDQLARSAARPATARVRSVGAPLVRRAQAVVGDVRLGLRMLAQHRLVEAERAFLDALALRSGQPAALSGLARVYLARGDVDQALALAQRAVAEAPQQASYHLTLGDALRVHGDAYGADAQYELAARLSPKQSGAKRGALPANPF